MFVRFVQNIMVEGVNMSLLTLDEMYVSLFLSRFLV